MKMCIRAMMTTVMTTWLLYIYFFSPGYDYAESWIVSGVGEFDAAEIDVNLGVGDDFLSIQRFYQGVPPQTGMNINLGAGNNFVEVGERGFGDSTG